jgi:hypothetical protein
MAVTDLIPGVEEVRMVIAGIVLLAVLGGIGYVWWTHEELSALRTANATLTSNNKILQENNDVIKNNFNVCTNANVTNQATVQSFLKERESSQIAITSLAQQKKAGDAIIGNLQQKLSAMEKDPANNGVLAPDLRETIRGIQAARSK